MRYDPQKHHRRSIRLKGYDYSRPGWYFVTIVTQNRDMLFGNVVDGKMVLNLFGKIIDFHWQKLPQHFKNMRLDAYQIMPNHFHGIIEIVGAMNSDGVGAMHSRAHFHHVFDYFDRNASPLQQPPRPHGTTPGSLGAIMQNFQSVTTRKINRIRKIPGTRLWQRNYWKHIIRNETELNRIRNYIINPKKRS